MNLSSTVRRLLPILTLLSVLVKAETAWDGDFFWKLTWRGETLETDLSLGVERTWDALVVGLSAKADEKGPSSLTFAADVALEQGIDVEAELGFDRKLAQTVDLAAKDLPIGSALVDLAATIKEKKGEFVLDEVTLGADKLRLAGCPGSLDLVFRDAFLRATARMDCGEKEVEVELSCKKGAFDQGRVTVEFPAARWSVKEVLTFKPSVSLAYPTKGALTAACEALSFLTFKLVCDHAFSSGWGVTITEVAPSVSAELEGIDLDAKATFKPKIGSLELAGYEVALSAPVDGEAVSLDVEFKVDEDGFDRLSFRVAISLSGR